MKMKCIKKETRTIFDLFKEYRCEECINYLDIEEIKIGYDTIYIYYMSSCKILFNENVQMKRVRLIFKDIIIDSMNSKSMNLFLWLDQKDDLSEYLDSFVRLIENGYQLHIII